ncbi:MAG: lysophospholipase [Bacteroidetes bacterium]|nr:MAG: lysophospholipase [Bacteroidota bacterium]
MTTFNITSSDGKELFTVEWSVKEPKAVIALVHGLGEHISRYDHLATFFNNNDIAVIGFDHRGHGQTAGRRGHSPGFEAMMNDVDALLETSKQKFTGIPVFLYGHSLGANLVLNHILRRKPDIKAAIASAPPIVLKNKPSAILVGLGKLMKNIYPGFVQPNGLDPNHISRDPEEVAKYINDPLVHNKVSAIMGMDLLDGGKWLDAYQGELPLPLLVMHGEDDQITWAKSSEKFAGKLGATFKKWEGLYHEIHNEPEQQQVFEYTLEWIQGQL